MLIVRLKGGLGNQMFQYAAAKALAVATKTDLKIDSVTGFRRDSYHRNYQLGGFRISAPIATPDELASLLSRRKLDSLLLRQVESAGRDFLGRNYCPLLSLWPRRRDLYLDGYWQSERYFASIGPTIRGEFERTRSLAAHDAELAASIAGCNSVAVHFRRKDYSQLCPQNYYETAIAWAARTVRQPHFFLFGDDPQWISDNIRPQHPWTLVASQDADASTAEFELMRRCKHHIIANSTFSWWAAWLAASDGQRVIAPARGWRVKERSIRDLIPDRWISL
jgi:hypothetical protein